MMLKPHISGTAVEPGMNPCAVILLSSLDGQSAWTLQQTTRRHGLVPSDGLELVRIVNEEPDSSTAFDLDGV
jgi:hypothetical protein